MSVLRIFPGSAPERAWPLQGEAGFFAVEEHLEEEGGLLGAIEDELEVGADAAGEPEAKMNPCKSE